MRNVEWENKTDIHMESYFSYYSRSREREFKVSHRNMNKDKKTDFRNFQENLGELIISVTKDYQRSIMLFLTFPISLIQFSYLHLLESFISISI